MSPVYRLCRPEGVLCRPEVQLQVELEVCHESDPSSDGPVMVVPSTAGAVTVTVTDGHRAGVHVRSELPSSGPHVHVQCQCANRGRTCACSSTGSSHGTKSESVKDASVQAA